MKIIERRCVNVYKSCQISLPFSLHRYYLAHLISSNLRWSYTDQIFIHIDSGHVGLHPPLP